MDKAIVLLSGGMDSATALYWGKRQGYELYALSLLYHYRTPKEIRATKVLVEKCGAKLIEVPIPFMRDVTDLREEGYPISFMENAPEGYMPMKNLIFYSLAIYYSEIYGINIIIGGHIQSDPNIYPDASREYFDGIENLGNQGTLPHPRRNIKILMPLIDKSKTEVLKLALELGVPLELTWSCFYTRKIPCGRCKACRERKPAFEDLKIPDPLYLGFPNLPKSRKMESQLAVDEKQTS